MRRSCFKALVCGLSLLCLLAGCAPEVSEDYAIVHFDMVHWQVTNAEGQEIYWRRDVPGNSDIGAEANIIEGDMEFWDEDMEGIIGTNFHKVFKTNFSDSFTVQTRLPMKEHLGTFEVEFYKDGQCVQNLHVGGSFDGTAALCADGTMELHGNFGDFSCYYTFEREGKLIELSGIGGRRVKIYPKDGDIVAEGMTGEYIIKNCSLNADNSYYEEVSREVRHGDS